jgi:hypothetical protein
MAVRRIRISEFSQDVESKQITIAIEVENREFSTRVRSEEPKQAFGAFLEKRRRPAELRR